MAFGGKRGGFVPQNLNPRGRGIVGKVRGMSPQPQPQPSRGPFGGMISRARSMAPQPQPAQRQRMLVHALRRGGRYGPQSR